MIQAVQQDRLVDFDEFIDWYPEQSEHHYELHDGVVITMPKPRGKHSQIAGYLMSELSLEIRRLGINYFIPRECILKLDEMSGYEPDVIVLDRESVKDEPRWEKESTIIYGKSVKLVIEVVSSNWSDDYALKLEGYQTMGIQEYWIVDYLGVGGRKFIGYPKQPTLTIYQLIGDEYQPHQFRGGALVESPTFPALDLTVSRIFEG
jgi:Uma2 family endonuclease